MSDNPAVISLKNLSFYRGQRMIFRDLDLKIPKGKVTAIMGPSGTGKTTLLHLIGGLLSPASGDITVLGQSVPNLSNKQLLQLRKRMGLLFQSGALFTDMSVYENIAFPMRVHTHLPEELIHTIVLIKLEAVGLRGAIDLMPSELSGGMSRRVALARAIALDPELMLYDEPFTGQDPISMGVIVKLIRELNESLNLTSVIVSHDVAEVCSIADYVYVLSAGRVIGQGQPDDVLHDQSPQVIQFMHGQPDGPVPFHYPAPDLQQALFEEQE